MTESRHATCSTTAPMETQTQPKLGPMGFFLCIAPCALGLAYWAVSYLA